jgi:hypothetical protein
MHASTSMIAFVQLTACDREGSTTVPSEIVCDDDVNHNTSFFVFTSHSLLALPTLCCHCCVCADRVSASQLVQLFTLPLIFPRTRNSDHAKRFFPNHRSPHPTDPSIASHDELTVALLQPLLCHAHPQIIMKVLFVLTSHDELGNTGKKTGFWLEEFAAPYVVFTLCTCTHLPIYVVITSCTCTHLPLVAPYVVPCARCAVCTCTHHLSQHLQHRALLPCARAPMPLIVLSFLIVPHSVMGVCACASILASRRCHVRTCATYLSPCVHVCLSRLRCVE